MLADPGGGGGGGSYWPTSGKDLRADPSSMRGYGKNVATIAKNVESDSMGPAMLINGGGDDVSISTGGYPEGGEADKLVQRNAQEMMLFLQGIRQNCLAVSSVAHICGDVYEAGDGGQAIKLGGVEWGFAMPGAGRPSGVPEFLDSTTLNDQLKQQDGHGPSMLPGEGEKLVGKHYTSGVVVYMYEAKDGTKRSVVHSAEGITETGFNKDGKEVYTTTAKPNGDMATTTYDQKTGKPINTSERTVSTTRSGNTVDEKTVVRNEDADGTATKTTDHKVTTKYKDGTECREYYTEDEDGNRSGERYIGRQPKKVTPEDWADEAKRNMEQSRRLAEGM